MKTTALRLPAALDQLEQYRQFVLDSALKSNVPEAMQGKLELVLEEMLVNVISYAYPGGDGEIEVTCALTDANCFSLAIRDWGPPFNPLQVETPDLDAGIGERPIGGLGIFFVKQMSSGVTYKRSDDANVLTILFALSA